MFEKDYSENILRATVVTEPFFDGQKVTAVILEYDRDVFSAGLSTEAFSVEDYFETAVYPFPAVPVNGGVVISPRRVCRVYANSRPEKCAAGRDGRFVILELDPADSAAPAMYLVGEHRRCRARMKDVRLLATQRMPIPGADASPIMPQQGVFSSGKMDRVMDEFIQGEFEGLEYSLYIPEGYDGSGSYPLVQFIADSWDVGPDCRTSLAQGLGGVIWAFPEEQRVRPCFVLCPHFPGPTIIEDDYSTRPEFETAVRLLEYVIKTYHIDRQRVYHTGQSMGAMAGFEWAARVPETFAGLLLFSGTGDPEKVANLKEVPIWLLASAADGRGYAILNRTIEALSGDNTKIGRYIWNGRAGTDALNALADCAAQDGSDIRVTLLEADSMIPAGMSVDGGGNHRGTWMLGYQLEALRAWLFSQKRKK